MLNTNGIGTPIARVEGGEYDGKIIYLNDPDKRCCEKCTTKCGRRRCCSNCEYREGGCGNCDKEDDTFDPLEILNEQYFRNKMKGMSLMKMQNIRKALTKKVEPVEDELAKIYKQAKEDIKTKTSYEFNLYERDGRLFPIANQNDEAADHSYIAAPTGSGKSTWVGKYAGEIRKLFAGRDIYLFSIHEEDKKIDYLEPQRYKIDDDLVDNPLTAEHFKDSIVIFDDIDTIKPERIAKAIRELRDDLLQNGRKKHVRCICTSHQMMDYHRTRDLLNSSQKIVYFPESTSVYHTKRFLKEYIGLDPKSIKKIREIKSRWIMISMVHPRYLLSESCCIILNKLDELCEIKEKERYDPNKKRKAA